MPRNPNIATMKRVAYTMGEVAAMTGRDRTTIWRWLNSGVLQRVKVPRGRDMISAASLEKLLRGDPARVGGTSGGTSQASATKALI